MQMSDLSPGEIALKIAAIVGDKHVLTAPADMAGFLSEPRDLWHGKAACVVRPGSTAEVAAIIRICREAHLSRRAAGRQYGPRRRPDPSTRSAGNPAVARAPDRIREIDPARLHADRRGRRRARERAGGRRERGPLFPLSLALRRLAAPSAALSPPTRAGPRCCAMARLASSCSASRSCCRPARCSPISANCARTTRATT